MNAPDAHARAQAVAEFWAELRGSEALGFVAVVDPEVATLLLDERVALAAELAAATERAETAEETLAAAIRTILGRYPEMTDAEAAEAAGRVAALVFSEQGARPTEEDS